METNRFDALIRDLATTRSRRSLLRILVGGILSLGAASIGVRTGLAQTCGDPSDACEINDDCCSGFYCNDDGICSGAAECAGVGGGCDADEICCGDLVCGDDRTCVEAATALPDTGSGSRDSDQRNLLIEAAAVAGVAAVVAVNLRERRTGEES